MAGSGALLSNLAVVAECVGDYDGARLLGERALAVRQEIGDPAGICVSQNNLGMIALLQQDFFGARDRVTESMRLAAEIGDPWMTSVGHHNLGNAYLGLGQPDEAGVHFTAALIAYEEHADRWSLALLVEDVALLALRTDQSAMAIELTGAADALRDELAAPRAPAAALALAGALVPAHASVGALGETHYDAGRAYDLATLSAAVKGVCGHA